MMNVIEWMDRPLSRRGEKAFFTLLAGMGAGTCATAYRDLKRADTVSVDEFGASGYRSRYEQQADARSLFWFGLATTAIGALGVVKPEALDAINQAINHRQH